ncbi:MAG: tetraacyldisaccharide 4'-kinase [Nitrospirae bacterium]|nr:tetraacyldisaccharide 4'-kinase [Nitrospirota bacterium]
MNLPELIYYIVYSIKKHSSLKNQKRLPQKVISIGNITLGGTGKTPATIALAEKAREKGFIPCILTRGYKGKAKGTVFVSKGEVPLLNQYQAGDEALLMAEKLKGVHVVKGKNRYEAGKFALGSLPIALSPDLFILDDGFQHWSLFRDKDILLINSLNPFGNKRLFPVGSLREPINQIKRADIIVTTNTSIHPSPLREEGKGRGISNLIHEIKQYNTNAPIFFAEHKPTKFIKTNGETMPLNWAKNKKFFGFCGIGNPQSFKETLSSINIELKGFRIFRDHYRYTKDDIGTIIRLANNSSAEWIVTTEKDIMRLKEQNIPENLIALEIEFSVEEGFYDEVFNFTQIQ